MDFVRLALENLYKASPKQARQTKFFLHFFTIYSITQTPLINCSRQLREHAEQNKRKLSLFRLAYFEIVPIVRARLQFGRHGLSLLFSLKPWKLHHPWRQSGIPGSLWLYIWSLQSTTHLKPFLRNFFIYERHVRYTQGWSNSSF